MTRIEELRAAIDDGVATESEVLEFDDLKHAVDCPPPPPREPVYLGADSIEYQGEKYYKLSPARLAAESLVTALEQIAKKAPHDVSREEAADMACEFVLLARAVLAKARGGQK